MKFQSVSSLRLPDPGSGMQPSLLRDHATTQPVFVVDDSFFRSRTPRPVHWSIAWSDLMMTMFILFLCLFIYQLAHRQFLSQTEPEAVAGSTIPVPLPESTQPIIPIFPTVSHDNHDVLKKIEKVPSKEETVAPQVGDPPAPPVQEPQVRQQAEPPAPPAGQTAEAGPEEATSQQAAVTELPLPLEQPESSSDSLAPKEEAVAEDGLNQGGSDESSAVIREIFDLSRQTLSKENLEKFAQVELIPDKAMRIVLTGDLLFPSGQAELGQEAKDSLRKLATLIRQTPYLIHVIGHTDSVPIHSARYPTNWELSTARASRVARFLVEEMQVPGKQIIVSGCSYFRPVRANTTAENRRANRRVEIVLSREEVPATIRTQSP